MVSSVNNCPDPMDSAQVALELLKHTRKLSAKWKKRSLADIANEKIAERAEEKMRASNEALAKSGQTSSVDQAPGSGGNNERIKLSDLFSRLKMLNENPEHVEQKSQTTTEISVEQRTTEIEVSLNVNRPVNGLERINNNLAQTDRYLFEFKDGATFTIKDKWSGKSTTIWGDPHVDVDDIEGNANGEFSDLKESDRYTTLMLKDGSRVTITALDSGIIEKIDIFNGSQHLQGTGAASEDWESKKLFDGDVKTSSGHDSSLSKGDIVNVGGDGNDWFNQAGQMVWGKTTGPIIYSRPLASLEVKIKQTIEQFSFSQTIDRQV